MRRTLAIRAGCFPNDNDCCNHCYRFVSIVFIKVEFVKDKICGYFVQIADNAVKYFAKSPFFPILGMLYFLCAWSFWVIFWKIRQIVAFRKKGFCGMHHRHIIKRILYDTVELP